MANALLDDPEFLAELEELDVRVHPGNREHRVTIDEWAAEQGRPAFDPDDLSNYAVPEPAPLPLTPLKFVGLMCAGAGAAALVFHDRVMALLSTF